MDRIVFKLEINSGDDALMSNPRQGIADLLLVAAQKVKNGAASGTLLDTNGNSVGGFEVEL